MKLNRLGVIKNGNYLGWNFLVEFDSTNTMGYYLYLWNENDGCNEWFKDEKDLIFYLKDYSIEWTNEFKSFFNEL